MNTEGSYLVFNKTPQCAALSSCVLPKLDWNCTAQIEQEYKNAARMNGG